MISRTDPMILIQTLVDMDVLEMTIPDNPNDSDTTEPTLLCSKSDFLILLNNCPTSVERCGIFRIFADRL